MDRNGQASSSHEERIAQIYPPDGDRNQDWGWPRFVKRSDLKSSVYARNGVVTIMCGVIIERESLDDPLCIPRSDIGSHFGKLLDSTEGSDVLFVIGGDTFPAHRAVLAARSPVFKAQLFGSMADAKMPSITMHDITSATFKAMLRFVYTDSLPEDDELELGDSPTPIEVFQDLLAVADRYALDRLKLICARKLWEIMSEEENFKKVVLTDGYIQLAQKFPSILAELREKALNQSVNAS
ncbi:hypothetical protein EJB05_48125, partial [Eragrostis curvula]